MSPPARRRTAGVLSLGAFALGTSAQAAEPGPHPTIKRSTVAASHAPHIGVPKTSKSKKTQLSAKVAQTLVASGGAQSTTNIT